MNESQKWHWQEGNKYAVEGIKTLLLLNGGAAVALLAFAGTGRAGASAIATALLFFGLGALLAGFVFVSAYLTQLQYGNSNWPLARRLHNVTYGLIAGSILAFIFGLLAAWCNLTG